jgi:hypothetical protein
MTPILTPDFTKVEAQIPIFEKGRYRVKVTKRTPFLRESKNEDSGVVHEIGGIRYALEMSGRYDEEGNLTKEDYAGRTVSPYTVWLHTDGGWKFGKPFLMAASGFRPKDEQLANEKLFQANEWDFKGDVDADAETFTVGSGFDLPVDRYVDVNLWKSVSASKDGSQTYENQEYGGWTPVED